MTEVSQTWVKWDFARWRNDQGLRLCGFAARALWMELLCIMHTCDPYGHLVINGRAPTIKEICSMVGGISERKLVKLLSELEQSGVYSRTEQHNIIFNRKMVRDHSVRQRNRENGRLGGNPNIKRLTPAATPPDKKGFKQNQNQNQNQIGEERVQGEEPKPPPEPTVRAVKARTKIKSDWQPTAAGIAFAKARQVPQSEVQAFRDFHTAKGNLMADWDAAWRTWCNHSVKFRQGSLLPRRPDDPSPMIGGF